MTMLLVILMLLSRTAISGFSDDVLAKCASSSDTNAHPSQCIPLESNKTGLAIPTVCLAYWPNSKCYVYTNRSQEYYAAAIRQEFLKLLSSPLLATTSQTCVNALLIYLCNYFFEGCDLARGVPRPICRNSCVDLVFASDCANLFFSVKLLGLPTLGLADFDCVITGFSEQNATTVSASNCVDTSDLSNTMVTATGSLSGTSVTWMAVMATMIGLMLVCFLGLCICLVLYANRLSRHGHQTIVTPRECRSPTTDRLRGSNQMQPHAASMEILPNLAENNDVIKEEDREVLPVQMISKFGEGEEEEEEEDSGVVSSGINQLRRALSVISLEESSEQCEQESVADFQLSLEDADILYARLSNVMLPFQDVRIIEKIGEGAFGHVYRGVYSMKSLSPIKGGHRTDIPVAIKTIKCWVSYAELKEFLLESALMSTFGHPNVLELVGICWDSKQRSPYIVLPYMENGDLRNFLRRHRGTATLSSDTSYPKGLEHLELTLMCFQIATGMEYIASMKLVHRDLAARNCMVDYNMVVKVADFGLTRDIYGTDYYRMHNRGRFPVKWMAPESLHDRISNEKTDVWSFGVTCWEVYSLGRSPYPAVSNHEILDYLEQGNRLKKPSLCSTVIYDIMLSCWHRDPQHRSSFSRLASQLGALLRQGGWQGTDTCKGTPQQTSLQDHGSIRSPLPKEVSGGQTSPTRRISHLKHSTSLKTAKPLTGTQVEPKPEPNQPLMDDIMEQLERTSPITFRSLKASNASIGASCPDITLKDTPPKSDDEYTVMYSVPPTRSTSLSQLVAKTDDRGPHAINRGRRASLQLHKIWTPIEEHDEVSMEHN